MRTKKELLDDPKPNLACAFVTNLLALELEGKDFDCLDISQTAERVYDDNLTSILNMLIRLNKDYTKEEIKSVMSHYSEFVCAMGLMLAKTAELDY